MNKIRVNIVSESDITVQGHGVHTAYVELTEALKNHQDTEVITGEFGKSIDCDVVHIHTVGPRTWRKLFQRGPKKVVSAHVVPDSFVGSLALAKYWHRLASWYLRWFYNRADLVLAVSKETKRSLLDLGVRRPIEVFTNHIDTSKYEQSVSSGLKARKDLGITESQFVVIGAGQVQSRKRVDCFLAAAKQLPDVVFIWVGGMPFGKLAAEHTQMKQLMDDAPSNLIFPGLVPLSDMPSLYRAADLFWLPSEQETFGLVAIEAAASGLPVMVRDIKDYDDTFGDLAVKASSDEEFIELIERGRKDKALYQSWVDNSKVIADRFDSRRAADKIVELYRRLIEV